MEEEEKKKKVIKSVITALLDCYNPTKMRSKITAMFKERFFRLFASTLEFEGVSSEERIEIIKRIWIDGSFAISRAKAPKGFEDESDLLFLKYATQKFDLYLNPEIITNVPLNDSSIVNKKRLKVGKDVVIVYFSDYTRAKRVLSGVRNIANRYINMIVNAMMTINTNLLTHKMPFVVACDEEEVPQYRQLIDKVFQDFPFAFVPTAMNGREPKTAQTNTPYIIDKLMAFVQLMENRFLDEIGVDNSKPLQANQDRLLMDEVNANNSLIDCFKNSIVDCINEGFEEAEELFGRRIRVKSRMAKILSIHEEKGKKENEENQEEQNDGGEEK